MIWNFCIDNYFMVIKTDELNNVRSEKDCR